MIEYAVNVTETVDFRLIDSWMDERMDEIHWVADVPANVLERVHPCVEGFLNGKRCDPSKKICVVTNLSWVVLCGCGVTMMTKMRYSGCVSMVSNE